MNLRARLARHDWIPLGLLGLGLVLFFAPIQVSPSGLSGDAARLGLQTFDFLRRGVWPFYIYHLFAPNPLIVFLQSPVFIVFGFTRLALRGVSTFAGVLAIPAVYLAGRELGTAGGQRIGRQAGLLAALGLLLSPFFGTFVRFGTEHALLPFMELLVVACLGRGLQLGRRRDFVLAGILLGLSQYAYIVARFLPVALVGAVGAVVLLDRRMLHRWRGLALTALTAALIALPQWWMFLTAPFTFIARTQQSAGQFIFGMPEPARLLAAKLISQLLMLGVRWETGYFPGSSRPLLNPILLIGLIIAGAAAIRGRRLPFVFSGLMAVLMFVPDLITYEGLAPSATRLIGGIPFVFLVAGFGLAVIWRWLATRFGAPRLAGWLVPLVVLLAGIEGQWDFAYRVLPRVMAAEGREWKASLVEMAEADYIAQHQGSALLIPISEYQRAPLAYLLAGYYPDRTSGPLLASESVGTVIVLQPADPLRPTTEGLPAGYVPDAWVLLRRGVAQVLPPAASAPRPIAAPQSLYAANGALAAITTTAEWDGATEPSQPAAIEFQNGLALTGFRVVDFAPGQTAEVTITWRPMRPIARDVQLFTQIIDPQGSQIAGIHDWPLRGVYRARAWQPGADVPLTYQFPIPPGLAPGPYYLKVGVMDLLQQTRVPTVDELDIASVATLKVPLPAVTTTPTHSLTADFGDLIRLTGFDLNTTRGSLSLTLFWQALTQPDTDYTVFVHVIDSLGNMVSQADAQPLAGRYPTSIWSAGEIIMDTTTLVVPSGDYQVYVGLYRWDTQERLPVTANRQRLPDDRLPLGAVHQP